MVELAQQEPKPDPLKTAGRELTRALEQVNKAVASYYAVALAAGREAPEGPTACGLDPRQLRQKLTGYVVARLSPKTGLEKPLLEFANAPEARKVAIARPLPGLS